MKKKGFLIAIEGIDGSGKSSLSHGLNKALLSHNYKVLLTKEPGDTPLGKKLRILLHEHKNHICDKAEFLLFAADRAQHFHEVIIPKLNNEFIIISDRMADSSLAYQGYGRGLNLKMIKQINQWAMCDNETSLPIEPDITFFLNINFKQAFSRIKQRGQKLTSFEAEEELFWKRVSDGFDTIYKNKKNVILLNAEESEEKLIEQTTKEVLNKLKNYE